MFSIYFCFLHGVLCCIAYPVNISRSRHFCIGVRPQLYVTAFWINVSHQISSYLASKVGTSKMLDHWQ